MTVATFSRARPWSGRSSGVVGRRYIVPRYDLGPMISRTPTKRLVLMTSIAAGLGVAGGLAAWVLVHLIDVITNVALFHELSIEHRTLDELQPSWSLYVAAVGGALLISLLAKWAPVIRGHGIPEAMEAVLTKQSRIAPRTALAKPVSAALAIGTGAPFGAEGPIIVTGGSIGSLLGQVIPVTPSERKILLAAGAAAGMSATFGAPLAAVVLAIELLLFEFSVRAFVPLVTAAAVAGGMHSALFEDGPLFKVPAHDYAGLAVLPLFVLLGVACGVLAIVITRGLFMVEDGYRRLPINAFWHPAIGAIGFATVGMFVPRALGVGYDAIGDVLSAKVAVGTAAGLAVGKLLAWWLALGSGTSGGTLAPILLISSSFGLVLGSGLNHLPGPDVTLGAFAVVAMAATFGAATQATFTAMVFVFELTRDYNVIMPLMLATVLADIVYSAVNDDSLMTEKLRRRGLRIGRHYGVDPFTSATVSSIMSTDVVTLPSTATVADARQAFTRSGAHGAYPIVNGDALVGIVSRGDLLLDDANPADPLHDHASLQVVTVGPDDTAQSVLRVMVDEHVEHVPVVNGHGHLLGICTRTDLLKIRRRQLELERVQRPKRTRSSSTG